MSKKKKQNTDNFNNEYSATNNENNKSNKDSNIVKKKKHGCCFVFMMIGLCFILVLGIGAGVGWIIGDRYTRANLDMSMSECFGVYLDVRKVNSKKLDIQSYNKSDFLSAEKAIKSQLFLKDGTDLQLDDLFKIIDAKEDYGFIEYLEDILTLENIDKTKLSGYAEDKYSDYVLKLSEKQLSAIANEAKDRYIQNFASTNLNQDEIELLKYAGIEQLRFLGDSQNPILRLTISYNTRTSVKSILKKETNYSFPILSTLLLPKKTYASVDLGVSSNTKISIAINNMSNSKMDRFYKFVKGITSVAGNEVDIEEELNKVATEKIQPLVDKTKDYADFAKATATKILEFDAYSAVVSLSGINNGVIEDVDKLTGKELLTALKGIVVSSPTNNTDATYLNKYKDISGNVYYSETGAKSDSDILVDYQQEFVSEIISKYCLSGSDLDYDKLLSLLTISGGAENTDTDFKKYLDANGIKDNAKKDSSRPIISNEMLGEILNSQVQNLISNDSQLSKLNFYVDYVSVSLTTDTKNKVHKLLKVGVVFDFDNLFDSQNTTLSILKNLISTKVSVAIELDITQNEYLTDTTRIETTLEYNDLTANATDNLLDIIKKIGLDFNKESILKEIEQPIIDAIDSMYNFMPSLLIEESKIKLPDVFDVIADSILENNNGADRLEGQDIKDVLNELYESDNSEFEDSYVNNKINEDYDAMRDELELKYYLYNTVFDEDADTPEEDKKTLYQRMIDVFGSDSFDSTNFNIKDNQNSIAYDNTSIQDLIPIFNDSDLGAAFLEIISSNDNSIATELLNIIEFSINHDGVNENIATIRMVVKLDVNDLFNDGFVDADLQSLINLNTIYAEIIVNVDSSKENGDAILIDNGEVKYYYDTHITINNMNDTEYKNFIKLINIFNGENLQIDFEKEAKNIGHEVYKVIKELNDKLGQNVMFVENGIKLPSIYSFLLSSGDLKLIDGEQKIQEEDAKDLIQGLYQFDLAYSNDANYKLDTIMVNELDSDYIYDYTDLIALLNTQIYDYQLAKIYSDYLKGTIDADHAVQDFKNGNYELVQLNVVSKKDFLRKWVDNFVSENVALPDDSSIFEFTLKMPIFEDKFNSQHLKNADIDDVYITVIAYQNEEGNLQVCQDENGKTLYRINSLSKQNMKNLENIKDFDSDSVYGTINDMMAKLSDFIVISDITDGLDINGDEQGFGAKIEIKANPIIGASVGFDFFLAS